MSFRGLSSAVLSTVLNPLGAGSSDGMVVGEYFVDLLVELKIVKHRAQYVNYTYGNPAHPCACC